MAELVFIGIDMDEDAMRASLDAIVLSAKEIEGGFEAWANHADPLPRWDISDNWGN